MATIYDVDSAELIDKAAEELKKVEQVQPPEWASFVKTGAHRERPPLREDWWYVRAASILRKLYMFGPVGVNSLRRKYGGKRNLGHQPNRVKKASGNIIRKLLQQLEEVGLLAKAEKGVHKGRIITGKGKSFVDKIASQIFKEMIKQRKVDEEIIMEEKAKQVKPAEVKAEETQKEQSSSVSQKPKVSVKPEMKKPEQKERIRPTEEKKIEQTKPGQKPEKTVQTPKPRPRPEENKQVKQAEKPEPKSQKPEEKQIKKE